MISYIAIKKVPERRVLDLFRRRYQGEWPAPD
ncbi:unnamed protein product [Linum tenue]|uniref:Uncharacterized protein n=1 Tax=Linum tenue TaxID=586396 RepID=A0AAV0MWZ3_9ROSI|nr:unnamed protein product [Linum tenue]